MTRRNPDVSKDLRSKSWERPKSTYVGHVGSVVQGGGGKPSVSPHDPGEAFKPGPQTTSDN